MPPDFTPDVKDLISKMLVLDPHKRIKVCFFFLFPPYPPLSLSLSCCSPGKKKGKLTYRWTT